MIKLDLPRRRLTDRTTNPPGTGWRHWATTPPLTNQPVQVWRREWGKQTAEVVTDELHPTADLAGLYWRRP